VSLPSCMGLGQLVGNRLPRPHLPGGGCTQGLRPPRQPAPVRLRWNSSDRRRLTEETPTMTEQPPPPPAQRWRCVRIGLLTAAAVTAYGILTYTVLRPLHEDGV